MLASSSKLGKLKKKIDKIKIKTDPAVKCMDDKKKWEFECIQLSTGSQSWCRFHYNHHPSQLKYTQAKKYKYTKKRE